jgi:hypothetical protein
MWHEFDNGLWNFLQSKVSCCLHMYFLWRYHLSPNKSENDQEIVTLIDSHIVLTYDWLLLKLLFSLQYFSESCFGNDNKFLLPNPWVVLFFIYPTFYSLKILFTQPFSLRSAQYCLVMLSIGAIFSADMHSPIIRFLYKSGHESVAMIAVYSMLGWAGDR